MKTKYFVFSFLIIVFTLSSCKFYFNEEDYLGIYDGSFESNIPTYIDCNGQVIISDVGDFKANFEIVTDSNPTIYFTNITITRGYSLVSNYLRFHDASYDFEGLIDRNSQSVYLNYNGGGSSYYDYAFNGTRQ